MFGIWFLKIILVIYRLWGCFGRGVSWLFVFTLFVSISGFVYGFWFGSFGCLD